MHILSTRQFWLFKISRPPSGDMILAGNSRVFLSLSPRHMEQICKNQIIYNFGFVACSLDEFYLKHAASLLKPESNKPTLVLGVTPYGLMRGTRANQQNGYLYWASQDKPDREELVRQITRDNYSGVAFLRTSARNALNLYRGQPLNRYFADGWEASLPIRKDPMDYVKRMEQVYRRRRAEKVMKDELLAAVAAFHRDGISIYGFRPPSNKHIRDMEDRLSGLDYHEFARQFEGAGGKWLQIDQGAFPTYDGIHMGYKTAIHFSRYLAWRIRDKA